MTPLSGYELSLGESPYIHGDGSIILMWSRCGYPVWILSGVIPMKSAASTYYNGIGSILDSGVGLVKLLLRV